MTEKEWNVGKMKVSKAGKAWPRKLGDTEVQVTFKTAEIMETLQVDGIVLEDDLLPSKVTYDFADPVHLKKEKDTLHITKATKD